MSTAERKRACSRSSPPPSYACCARSSPSRHEIPETHRRIVESKPENHAMTMPVTQCLIKLHEAHHDLEDYEGGVPRWCSGCGDNAILSAVQRLCRDENLAPER